MPRVPFSNIFVHYPDGTIEPNQPIRIGGVTLGPGVRFGKGVTFAGVDLGLFIGHDLEIENADGVVTIKAIYQ